MNRDAAEPTLVHADDDLVVVDKPAGCLAVPGRGPERADCTARRVQRRWPDALVVHRLDQATSGLLLFARGAATQRLLGGAFAERAVDKRYVALVAGRVRGERGRIELALAADWPNRPRQRVDAARGKPSITDWRVVERGVATTRLELQPLSGRTHQLRVHLQVIGHPIVGDALYAPDSVQDPAGRLMLHATRLAFTHPMDGRPLSFHSPAPF